MTISLKDWFQHPVSTLTTVDAYCPPQVSTDLFSTDPAFGIPPPQRLYDVNDYRTPFGWLWRRKANVLQG